MRRRHNFVPCGVVPTDGFKCTDCNGWVMTQPLPIGECPGRKTSMRAILITKCGATQTVNVPYPAPPTYHIAIYDPKCPTCGHNPRYQFGSSIGAIPAVTVEHRVTERVFEREHLSSRDTVVYRER